MSEEEVLLEQPGVRVSVAKVQLSGATYPTNGITSVRTKRVAPSPLPALFLGGGGTGAVLLGLSLAGLGLSNPARAEGQEAALGTGLVLTVGGLLMLWLGWREATQLSPRFSVVIGTAAGERSAYSTRDEKQAETVRAAIEQAITKRG